MLLEKGADVEAKDKAGWTPFKLAAYQGHKAVAVILKGVCTLTIWQTCHLLH